jgi:two-component system NtrC family response regulator
MPLPGTAFGQIIGSSNSMRVALEAAARVAPTDATILLRGETGTGKELVAKAIHLESMRRSGDFVTVSCGAIPSELLESELFGHTKGSFTGALAHKLGKVEMADHGTLFLDEIGDMPLELQVGILRLLQEREIEKIGALAPAKVDVRIIAATHRNLETMVGEGSFREDLYYRLLVVPIELPPLRKRGADTLELLRHFFDKYKSKYERRELTLPPELLPHFLNHDWPGNVRQLEHTIERLVLLCHGPTVGPADLPDFLKSVPAKAELLPGDLPDTGLDMEAVEKELIVRALDKFEGNRTRAARFLSLSRRAMSYRMQKHGVSPAGRGEPKAAAG